MQVAFRRATDRDIEEIARLERSLFGVDAYSRSLLHYLLRNADFFEVAVDEGRGLVVGYIIGEVRGSVGHLISIGVDRRYQRRGIGSGLLGRFIGFLKERGVGKAYLEVSVNNSQAVRFYEKHGFRVLGRVGSYYSDGSDAYVMLLEL
uniref:Ribosomal-protein-alanine N-acetyltransferase n=1 Tax=Fervidicoccus fontis TaxID=683846 RepID=A0A7J3ZJR0_9CREN